MGDIPPLTEKLLRVTEESLVAGIGQLSRATASTMSDWPSRPWPRGPGSRSYGVMSATPSAPRCTRSRPCPTTGPAPRAEAATGMVFAVEPMVNVGAAETVLLDDGWTVVTADGSLSAHFEHTIAVTDDGPEVLTVPG